MIVGPAVFEQGRTVWLFETEQNETVSGGKALWIDGFIRPISPDIEAIWLGLVLGPLANDRLILPRMPSEAIRAQLEGILGLAIQSSGRPTEAVDRAVSHRAALVRDPLDRIFGTLARVPPTFTLECHPDPQGLGANVSASHIWTNGGTLRRSKTPLDRVGEFAAALMLAPTLALGRIDSFLCADELAGIGAAALCALVAEVEVAVRLPFGNLSAACWGGTTRRLGIPPLTALRSLWERYRMAPPLMAAIYRSMVPEVARFDADDPIVRICRHMAEVNDAASPGTEGEATFEQAYFATGTILR